MMNILCTPLNHLKLIITYILVHIASHGVVLMINPDYMFVIRVRGIRMDVQLNWKMLTRLLFSFRFAYIELVKVSFVFASLYRARA